MTESESIEVAKLSNENQFIDDEYETERQRIHNQLSTMSFEDLQKLKDDMGSKLYNKTVFGDKQTRKEITFKRANKNRPREMTSKKHLMPKDNFIPVKKHFALDPRFEPMCGTFDKKAFKSNYKFLNDLRKKEKKSVGE
jgi:ribosomal RNA-processing protein 36